MFYPKKWVEIRIVLPKYGDFRFSPKKCGEFGAFFSPQKIIIINPEFILVARSEISSPKKNTARIRIGYWRARIEAWAKLMA